MARTEARKRAGVFLLLLIALALPMAVRAQSAYETARSGSLGIRLDGGLSWSLGGGFANTGGNTLTVIQPQGNVGLYYNLSPRFRAGLDYNYSRMIRSQMNNTQSPFPDGDGEVFRDLKTHFHGAEFTCEFNLVGSGRISLYAGLGVGCLFSVGNIYTIGVKNEIISGGLGNKIQVTGHNAGTNYAAPFIPFTLSLEYAFLPQVAVSFGGGYRIVLAGKNDLSPKGQAFTTLGLRFNLR